MIKVEIQRDWYENNSLDHWFISGCYNSLETQNRSDSEDE